MPVGPRAGRRVGGALLARVLDRADSVRLSGVSSGPHASASTGTLRNCCTWPRCSPDGVGGQPRRQAHLGLGRKAGLGGQRSLAGHQRQPGAHPVALVVDVELRDVQRASSSRSALRRRRFGS
jgi:hypothetical protein